MSLYYVIMNNEMMFRIGNDATGAHYSKRSSLSQTQKGEH